MSATDVPVDRSMAPAERTHAPVVAFVPRDGTGAEDEFVRGE